MKTLHPQHLVALLVSPLLVGCIMPPKARTIPADGPSAANIKPPSMTSPLNRGENPFKGAWFYIRPESSALRTAEQWRATRPADAAAIEKIANQPVASWMGNWNPNIEKDVDILVTMAVRSDALPVMIAYNLPFRDCGSYSGGGAGSPGNYKRWIDAFARGIGKRRAVVVLEPDGLPLLKKCLSPEKQQQRLELVRYAVQKFTSLPGTAVYIDAGHSDWIEPKEMAERLKAAGIDEATGFSLNVSNYKSTPQELAYGKQLSALVGGKHFIIDTSRNGNGAPEGVNGDDEKAWCNPDGRALGTPPTTQTGEPLCDAFFWLKVPGESDGTCNGGPKAGNWWPVKALELAKNAKY